jgi:multiple sugar transport system ATP-binding protein
MLGIRTEHIIDDEELFEKYGSVLELKVEVAELLGASTNIYVEVSGYNVCAVVKLRNDLRID